MRKLFSNIVDLLVKRELFIKMNQFAQFFFSLFAPVLCVVDYIRRKKCGQQLLVNFNKIFIVIREIIL